MSICVQRHADLTPQTLSTLSAQLEEFYSQLSGSYYTISDRAAEQYTAAMQPFHCDLARRVTRGATLVELGCGTAHLCRFVEEARGSYVGLDYSESLLRKNRERFPRARFFHVNAEPGESFDLVASLYTIEHVVDPGRYLEKMWRFCKPGGLIGVICPDFIEGDGFPPSFYYGKTPRRLREKLAAFSFADCATHLLDLFFVAPRWKSAARSAPPGAFWINLRPRILHGASYSIDADAVHLPRLVDLVHWFQNRGAEIVTTSRLMAGIDPEILRHNCYVLARKPAMEPLR